MPYRISGKYRALWDAHTRYIIVSGGRGSGKSYALACAMLDATYEDEFNILYTRYNLTSAEVSIIPEFVEKMDIGDCRDAFYIRRRDVQNRATGGRIWFRGIQQASRHQIARLKSLSRLKTWVLDEAQELTSESTFDTIDQSIREKDAENRVILVLNPADISHWIYRRFFVEAGVPYDFNGTKGNVTYIHTTWEDNRHNLSQSFIDLAETLRERKPEKYEHLYGGKWLIRTDGVIYRQWQPIAAADYPDTLPQWYGNDWGFGGDPDALVRMCYDAAAGILYVREICYETGLLPRDIAARITADARTLTHHYEPKRDERGRIVYDGDGKPQQVAVPYTPELCEVYCDPARPDSIAELRRIYGISAVPAVNRNKNERVAWLQGFRVRYVGEHIGAEVDAYSWKPNPNDEDTFTGTPQDGNDHAMDAINYGAFTHLHRLGINNEML